MSLFEKFSADSQSKFNRLIRPQEFVPAPQIISKVPEEPTALQHSKKRKQEANNDQPKDQISENSEIQVKVTETEEEKSLKAGKTLFIGNLSTTTSVKDIKKLCAEYGEVESIRLRSVPIAGTAVDESGNQDLVKKVCAIKKKFGEQKGSMNAYVVYKDPESVNKALVANNTVLDKRHLRFDRMIPSVLEPKRTVFIGGLQHYADEEKLRDHFASVCYSLQIAASIFSITLQALPNGQDDIECLRIIRDNETLLGKGIAYLSFKTSDCVLAALSLHQVCTLFDENDWT
jgi:nucleolar protein 12